MDDFRGPNPTVPVPMAKSIRLPRSSARRRHSSNGRWISFGWAGSIGSVPVGPVPAKKLDHTDRFLEGVAIESTGRIHEPRHQHRPLTIGLRFREEIRNRNFQAHGQPFQGFVIGKADPTLKVGNRIDTAVDKGGKVLLGEARRFLISLIRSATRFLISINGYCFDFYS